MEKAIAYLFGNKIIGTVKLTDVGDCVYYEIDIYEHLKDKAICEVELTRTSELQLPSIIEVIEDITNNEEYTSYYFASIK